MSIMPNLRSSLAVPNDMVKCCWTEEREQALIAFYSGEKRNNKVDEYPVSVPHRDRTVCGWWECCVSLQNTAYCGTRSLWTTATASSDWHCWRFWAVSCPTPPWPSQVARTEDSLAYQDSPSAWIRHKSSRSVLKRRDRFQMQTYRMWIPRLRTGVFLLFFFCSWRHKVQVQKPADGFQPRVQVCPGQQDVGQTAPVQMEALSAATFSLWVLRWRWEPGGRAGPETRGGREHGARKPHHFLCDEKPLVQLYPTQQVEQVVHSLRWQENKLQHCSAALPPCILRHQ